MFHTGAYFNSALAAAALTDVAAVTDPVIAISNNHFLPQEPLNLIGAYTAGATIAQAQVNSPKIRQVNPCMVRPISASLLAPTNYNQMFFEPNQLAINPQEELQFLIQNGGVAEPDFGLVWFADQIDPIPPGDIYVAVGTVAFTTTARAWTINPYTLTSILPAGTYAMVWSEYVSASVIAHRWVFDQQVFRPGFVGFAAQGSRHPIEIYQGKMGKMGTFYTYSLPRLELLCNAADTTGTLFMAVVRTGASAAESL